MKLNSKKISLVLIAAASALFCGNADAFSASLALPTGSGGHFGNGGAFAVNDDFFLRGDGKTYENFAVSGNGGVIYAQDELGVSGAIIFKNNRAEGKGGAIWADDDVVFAGSGNGTTRFSGNTAAGAPNDIYLADNDDRVVFRRGNYELDGGLDLSRGGNVVFENGAGIEFIRNAKNTIGGKAYFREGSQVQFGTDTQNIFSGGIVVESGVNQRLGGNVTLGREIRLEFSARTQSFGSVDLTGVKNLTIKAGTKIVLEGVIASKNLQNPTNLLVVNAADKGVFRNIVNAGIVVGDTPFGKIETLILDGALSGNAYSALAVQMRPKTDAEATASIGGNSDSALTLGYREALNTATYGAARNNAGAATGELVASAAHSTIARIRATANQTTRFLMNEITGSANGGPAGTQTASYMPRERRVLQAATDDALVSGSTGTQTENPEDFGWEISFAYFGQSGDVAEDDGYNGYDYDYGAAWLGAKNVLSLGTLGVALELGEGETQGAGSKIETEAWGVNAFFFFPITDAGTYALVQGGLNLGDNELTRRVSGANYTGSFDSSIWYLQCEAGTNFELLFQFSINPYVSLAYMYYESDGFSDRGNVYGSADFSEAEIKPGVRLYGNFNIVGMENRLTIGWAWICRSSDDAADLSVSRAGSFANVYGNSGDQSFAELSADWSIALTNSLNLSAGYAYTSGGAVEEHDFYTSVGWRF